MTPYYADDWLTILQGDCRAVLAELPAESVHCVVTSPPYWGLRDYGNDGQLGLEATPEAYVAAMVEVFREVRRVLRKDGTLWLNLGDSYAGPPPGNTKTGVEKWASSGLHGGVSPVYAATLDASVGKRRNTVVGSLKPKDLVGIPWRVAFALQADGWYLRSDIIWAKPNPMPESVTDRPTKSHEYLFLLSKSARYYYDGPAIAEPLTDTSIERLTQPTLDEQEGSARVHGKTNGRMKAVGGLTGGAYSPPGQAPPSNARWPGIGPQHGATRNRGERYEDMRVNATRNARSVWTVATQPYPGAHFATFPRKLVEPCIKAGCPPDVCSDCGNPVEYDREPRTTGVSGVRHGVSSDEPTSGLGVLLPDLLEQGNGTDEADDQGLRRVTEGLHPSVPTWASDGDEDGLRRGAPIGDGRDAGTDAVADRSRGSHQRDKERQSAGEPAGTLEEGPRRSVEPWSGADGDLPGLREPLPVAGSCGQCGADLARVGGTSPGVVLDCFAGSGTTGMVAQSLSRRAILIDLNADYLVQAMGRNRDIPLGLVG